MALIHVLVCTSMFTLSVKAGAMFQPPTGVDVIPTPGSDECGGSKCPVYSLISQNPVFNFETRAYVSITMATREFRAKSFADAPDDTFLDDYIYDNGYQNNLPRGGCTNILLPLEAIKLFERAWFLNPSIDPVEPENEEVKIKTEPPTTYYVRGQWVLLSQLRQPSFLQEKFTEFTDDLEEANVRFVKNRFCPRFYSERLAPEQYIELWVIPK